MNIKKKWISLDNFFSNCANPDGVIQSAKKRFKSLHPESDLDKLLFSFEEDDISALVVATSKETGVEIECFSLFTNGYRDYGLERIIYDGSGDDEDI